MVQALAGGDEISLGVDPATWQGGEWCSIWKTDTANWNIHPSLSILYLSSFITDGWQS